MTIEELRLFNHGVFIYPSLGILATYRSFRSSPPQLTVSSCRNRGVISAVNLLERITTDPAQCGGKPCIRGLRIRVKDVLEMLGSGMTETDILAEFPYLQAEDIRAAQLYAARLTDRPVLRSA